jgi:hypothetical protein
MKNQILAAFLLLSTSVFAYDRIPVNLPACDADNPKVLLIDEVTNFSQINSPDKTIFCVMAGNYDALLRITISGTATEPRYIRHLNPTTHPALMPEADRAVIRGINFLGSDYWVVDSITVRQTDGVTKEQIRMLPRDGGSDHIMLNKLLVEDGGGAGMIAMGGHDLTVQDSVIRNSFVTPNKDDNGVVFRGHNNKLIGNEIYNHAGDSILVIGIGGEDNQGAVIADNELYITPDYRTDGQGNFSPLGEWLCGENATDFKGGGTEASPLIYTGNRVWGFDRNDDHACVSGGGGEYPISIHFNARYIEMEDNIFYNNLTSIIFTAPEPHHITFQNNLFSDMEYVVSAPHHKTHTNKYIDNFLHDIRVGMFYEEPDEVNNEISGNIALDKKVCWIKYQITNPTEICVGTDSDDSNAEAEAIAEAAVLFKNPY